MNPSDGIRKKGRTDRSNSGRKREACSEEASGLVNNDPIELRPMYTDGVLVTRAWDDPAGGVLERRTRVRASERI
jgi:hypothetical protein